MKKLGKWRYVLAASFVVVLFLTFWPQLFHEQIEDVARKEIGKRVDADVTFSHLDISLWRNFPDLTITLKELNITTRGSVKDSLLRADEIAAAINSFDYVRDGHIDITRIFLVKPLLHAHVEPDGSTNFSILKKDTTATDTTSTTDVVLHLEHLVIEDGHISYIDEVSDNLFDAQGFNFDGKGEFSSSEFDMSTKISSHTASLKWEGRSFFERKKIDLDLLLALDRLKNSILIKESDIKINTFSFLLTGGMTLHPDRYEVDINFSSPKTTLIELLSLTNFFHDNIKNIQSDGKVHFAGFVKGNYIPGTDSVPKFEVKLEVKEGTLKIDTVDESIDDIHFDLLVSNNVGHKDSTEIEMDSVFFGVKEHSVQGHAHIHRLVNSHVDALIVGSIHAEDLLAVYPIRGLKAEGELNFNIEAVGNYSSMKWPEEIPHVDFDIDMKKGMLKYDSLPDSLNNISFHMLGHIPQGNWQQSKIELGHLVMNIGDNPVTGKLKIENFEKPKVQGHFNASIHMEDILNVLPVEGTEMKGTLKTSIDVDGVYDPKSGAFPRMTASLNIENGFYKTSAYPEPLENVQIKASLTNNTSNIESTILNIQQLNYTLEGEPFELTGVIKDFKSFGYDLIAKGAVDLDKITKIYPLKDYVLSGKILSDIKISGTLADLEADRYDKTKASGSVKLENIRIEGKKLPQMIHIPVADFKLTPEVIQLTSMKVRTGHSSFDLSGELHDYFCFFTQDNDQVLAKLKLVADTLDLNEWKSVFTSTEVTTPSLSSGAAPVVSVWQVPAFMDFDFDSNVGLLRYEDMILTEMAGEIRMVGGIMSIRESGFNSLNAKFQASGTYDSQDIIHPSFDFKLKIAELDIQKAYKEIKLVRELLPAAADAEGSFSIDYYLKGELEPSMYPKTSTIIGNGDIHIANAKINGMKMFEQLSKAAKKDEMNDPHLKDFTMSTEIRDNKIFVKPFKLKVSGFNTEIEGVNEISGTIDYIIKVQLLPLNLLKAPFHVTGTYDNPKVALGKGHDIEGLK